VTNTKNMKNTEVATV